MMYNRCLTCYNYRMISIEVILPKKISTNTIYAGKHWAVRKKEADMYHEEFLDKKVEKITDYPININYIFEFKGKPLDTSNCSYMAKLLEDGMVKKGIIEDDDPKYVAFTGLYSQKGTQDKVTIIIS